MAPRPRTFLARTTKRYLPAGSTMLSDLEPADWTAEVVLLMILPLVLIRLAMTT